MLTPRRPGKAAIHITVEEADQAHMHLRGGRALLREQMAASPLCDIQTYVSHLEALLHRMWAVYCAGDKQRVINLRSMNDI